MVWLWALDRGTELLAQEWNCTSLTIVPANKRTGVSSCPALTLKLSWIRVQMLKVFRFNFMRNVCCKILVQTALQNITLRCSAWLLNANKETRSGEMCQNLSELILHGKLSENIIALSNATYIQTYSFICFVTWNWCENREPTNLHVYLRDIWLLWLLSWMNGQQLFPDKNLLESSERRLNCCNSRTKDVLYLEYLRSNKRVQSERSFTCCCTNVEFN